MDDNSPIVRKLRERALRHAELTELVGRPGIEPKKLPELLKERGQLEASAELAARTERALKSRAEARALLADNTTEAGMQGLAREELAAVEAELSALDGEIKAELVGDADLRRDKVIVEVRAGTGGDEAALFAADLLRLYQRYAEVRGWKVEILESSSTELGGLKEVSFAVHGPGAWRYLRFESGGHRVQRVPATEASGRIHTSAATVAVLPEAEEVDLQIRPEDITVETMRAGGAGGQHVNKTESAVRITHVPSGVVVVCMDERSQHKNRQRAMRILRSRLFEAERLRLHAERAAKRKTMIGSGDRSERIRTYNYPQNRISDHRLGQNFSLEHVMAGKLHPLVEALDALEREERIREL